MPDPLYYEITAVHPIVPGSTQRSNGMVTCPRKTPLAPGVVAPTAVSTLLPAVPAEEQPVDGGGPNEIDTALAPVSAQMCEPVLFRVTETVTELHGV